MKILFLGTGAADFPEQLNNDNSFGLNDKSVRKSSSVLIDDELLIDCGPHTLNALKYYNVNVLKIKHLILTHLHGDHFNYENVKQLAKITGGLNVWYKSDGKVEEAPLLMLHKINAGEQFSVSGYKITPLNANHTANPLHYLIEDGFNKKLFYALDGSWILNDTFYRLKDKKVDAWIVDATVGDYNGDFRIAEHNSIPMIRILEKSYKTTGIITENTKIVLSHIAVTLNKPYGELCDIVKGDNYTVAYDGLTLNI